MGVFCPKCGNLIINGKCTCNSDKKRDEYEEIVSIRNKKEEKPVGKLEKLIFVEENNERFVKHGVKKWNERYIPYYCQHEVEILVPVSLIEDYEIWVEKSNVDCYNKECRVRKYCKFKAPNKKAIETLLYIKKFQGKV